MVLWPFSRKSKQRIWAAVSTLGGLLLAAIGLGSELNPIFLGINLVTSIGIIAFIIGLIYLIDILS